MLRCARVTAFEAVPGLEHGFERRSAASEGDSREDTRSRVRAALADRGALLLLKQVHGVAVRRAPWPGQAEGDAATVDTPGLLVGIETADCLPLLLVDPEARVAAAAHAGWRGTAAGIARHAVAAMQEAGAAPERVLAAVGPGAGVCCYAVGPELRGAFGAEGADHFVAAEGRTHLDLREANRRQLVTVGVREEAIGHVAECTICRPEDYHSYRRDGPGSGRMLSWVGWRG